MYSCIFPNETKKKHKQRPVSYGHSLGEVDETMGPINQAMPPKYTIHILGRCKLQTDHRSCAWRIAPLAAALIFVVVGRRMMRTIVMMQRWCPRDSSSGRRWMRP